MIAVSVLFVLAGLFAVGAIIADRLQRKRTPTTSEQENHWHEHRHEGPAPGVMELSNYGARLLAEVERKRQVTEEAIRQHKATLEELAIDEAKIRSGLAGEARLDELLYSLDDSWTIIAGYRAQEGEIDRILVGPNGVFAFEVKNLGGIIHCNGDRWWRDKTDRRGNVVERNIPIADNGGRSPSRQINDAADALERLIKGNGHEVEVVRVVVLTHPRAALGHISQLNIHFLAHVQNLDMQRVLSRGTPLFADQERKILTAIRRHHEWFERRERQHSRPSETLSRAFLPSP